MSLHAVVLAGGTGSRLWPRSTPESPKQFQSMLTDVPLLVHAVQRGERFAGDRMWLVTDARYVPTAARLAPHVDPRRVLGEPRPRGTLGAVTLAAAAVFAEDPDGVLALLPSDHLCQDEARLAAAVELLVDHLGPAAIGLVATPTNVVAPAFGHVRPGPAVASGPAGEIAPVTGYVEKPQSAADLGEGSWLRNMGIVVGHARTLLEAAPPAVADAAIGLVAGDAGAVDAWAALDADRIEDVVLPGNRALMVASTPVEWIDVGTWPALFERADVEPSGNLTDGDVTVNAGTGNVVMSTGARVAAIGVDDLLIVSTPDQVLVCAREYADRVRAVLAPACDPGPVPLAEAERVPDTAPDDDRSDAPPDGSVHRIP